MLRELRPAILILVLLTLITGLGYPLAMTAIAGVIFPKQAQGSLIEKDGKVIGSSLIGQEFKDDKYFHGRPSATSAPDPADSTKTVPAPYNAANSGGSNLGPTSKALNDRIKDDVEKLKAENPTASFPVDLVTTSASGLDPDISPEAALFQVPRVAKARNMPEDQVRQLVTVNSQGRLVGLLGEPRGASSRLTLAQAVNSLGHTLSPALIGPLILSVAVLGSAAVAQLAAPQREAYRIAQAQSVQLPYLGIAAGLLVLASLAYLLRLPPLTEATEQADPRHHTFSEVLRHRHLRLGVIAIFLYVGAEVSIGSFLINYIATPRIGNIDASSATRYVSYYHGAAMLGRFAGSLLLLGIAPRRLLCLFALAAIALLATTMSSSGALAMWSVVAIGLFNSIMFPTLFTLGIEGLGPMTAKASSLLVMAIVGGAVIPLLQGLLADRTGVQPAFVLPLLCYAYIAWYALQGSPQTPASGRVRAA